MKVNHLGGLLDTENFNCSDGRTESLRKHHLIRSGKTYCESKEVKSVVDNWIKERGIRCYSNFKKRNIMNIVHKAFLMYMRRMGR